jgi:hypothetical protein
MNDTVKTVRQNLAKLGGSELAAVASNDYLKDLFEQKQSLMREMNVAKRLAADEAAKPYLETIAEIDRMYAMMLTLLGNNEE